jgi:hypothetical protein
MASTFREEWKPTSPNQLVTESYHDGAFIKAVARAHGAPTFDYTAPLGEDGRPIGKSGFKRHLLGMLYWVNRGDVRNVVVVGDNDTDHDAALVDVRRAIREAKGYPTPDAEPCEVATNGTLRVGVIMVPGTGRNGCLETLLLTAPIQCQTLACVDSWATCCAFPAVPANNCDKFRLRSVLLASIVTDPNISLSLIWSKAGNPIDPASRSFSWIADFLKVAFA